MNYPEGTPTIHAALLAAQQSIRAVAKDATNNHQRYDYVSAENMIQHCRDALHRHGLTLTAGDVVLAPLPARTRVLSRSVHIGADLAHGRSVDEAHAVQADDRQR